MEQNNLQLVILYGTLVLIAGGFLLWLYTPWGKKWLKNL